TTNSCPGTWASSVEPLSMTYRNLNFVAGTWRGAVDGKRMAVLDPATLETMADVPDSGPADAAAALDAAQAAFPAWRSRTGRERAQLLKKWNALIVEHQEDLAR